MRKLAGFAAVGTLAALLSFASPAFAEEASSAAVAPAVSAATNPCAPASELEALFAAPEAALAAEVAGELTDFPSQTPALQKTCKCSCGRQPCSTSADCGGGFCSFGITCC